MKRNLLYAFYGDDFTGSTDVLESLGVYGVNSVLFTRIPSRRTLAAFSHCRAMGIAGESRSRSPAWMNAHLPAIFRALRRLGAPVNHYKVCSTFDSSPRIGNIGRAIELGRSVFGPATVPVVVGAPRLGRAVVFGNLYATADGEFHRIDRHPTMRRHPVTPMTEADLRRHLARQTSLRIGAVDVTAFASGSAGARLKEEEQDAQAVVFDGFNEAMLDQTAQLIWDRAAKRQVFAVGSSGLTHGLLLHWRSLSLIQHGKAPAHAEPAEPLLVLSGSCSPATAKQIRGAQKAGFAALRVQGDPPWDALRKTALNALGLGESVVLYTALGPRRSNQKLGESFGAALGSLLRRIVVESGVRRVLIAGGDTSTHAVKQLGLDALTFVSSLAPGVPLCRVYAPGSPFDGLELALKGGQMGAEDFFSRVRDGGRSRR
jgi:3-oxoisoapionate kinase